MSPELLLITADVGGAEELCKLKCSMRYFGNMKGVITFQFKQRSGSGH
jgi:hypothetical protein